MDDARIDQIRREVLSELAASPPARASGSLESRVAALEAAVAELARGSRAAPALPRGLATRASRCSPSMAAPTAA